MKKLIITLLLLAMAALSWSATTSTIATTRQTVDYSWVKLNFVISDSTNIALTRLYWGTGEPALKDSVSLADLNDSVTVTGLQNGTTFNYYYVLLDTTANDTTLIKSLRYSVTTTDYVQTLSDSGESIEGATVIWDHVEGDTGTAIVYLYLYTVEDSLWSAGLKDSIVEPRKTITDTATVTFTSPITAADSVIWYFSPTKLNITDLEDSVAIDTSLADTSTSSTIQTSLPILTWLYYAAVVCSSDVRDTLAIDSLYTIAPDSIFVITGLEEGETYYYGTVGKDSALTDTSAIYSFTTLDYTAVLTRSLVAGTPTSITVTVTPDTSTDFNGADSINLFEGAVSDSLTDVATITLAETLSIASIFDATDSCLFCFTTISDSAAIAAQTFLTDTTLGDSATFHFIKTGLYSSKKYYYSAIACSADVRDTVAIDSVTTGPLMAGVFSRTGKLRGGWYHFQGVVYDSSYHTLTNQDSIYIPTLTAWENADIVFEWSNMAYMPGPVTVSMDGFEKIFYKCWQSGATYRASDSVKLMIYDDTWGLMTPLDSTALLTYDTNTVAVDSVVACIDKEVLKFGMVCRRNSAEDDIIGLEHFYINYQRKPF